MKFEVMASAVAESATLREAEVAEVEREVDGKRYSGECFLHLC
jgi:hypothetical protein